MKEILLVTFIAISLLIFNGCCDLNFEVQQTQRVNTSAARNPVNSSSDVQGSERVQGKVKTGVETNADIASHTTKSTALGSDTTGAEK